jgi:hypothetical protein
MPNLFPNKFSSNKYYKVPEVTEILIQWGLSKNDKKTRDLITRGRLQAIKAGNDPDDRRSGYMISEKSIYDFIISQIPIAKEIIDTYNNEKAKKQSNNTKPKSKSKTKPNDDKVIAIDEAAATKE